MIFMNIFLSFLFQRYCVSMGIKYMVGYLFEGNLENLPNSLFNLTGHIEEILISYDYDAFGNQFKLNKSFFDRLPHQYTLDIVQEKKIWKFRYICCDENKLYWRRDISINNWNVYNTYVIEMSGVYFKMAGLTKENRKNNEGIDAIYVLTNKKLRLIFKEVAKSYWFEFKRFKERYNDYRNKIKPSSEKEKSEECKKEVNVRSNLLSELNYLINNDFMNRKEKDGFEGFIKRYSIKKIKEFIGDANKAKELYTVDQKKTFIHRYYDLMNEISLFLDNDIFTNYILLDPIPVYNINKRKVIILKANLNPKAETGLNPMIKHSDIKFYKNQNTIIKIADENIIIHNSQEKKLSYIVIDKDALKSKSVKSISVNGCERRFHVQEDLYN